MNCLPRKQSISVWFESIRLISFHNLFYLTIVWRLHVRAYFQGYICLSVDCRSLVISLTTIVVKIMGQLNAQRAELNIIYDGHKETPFGVFVRWPLKMLQIHRLDTNRTGFKLPGKKLYTDPNDVVSAS